MAEPTEIPPRTAACFIRGTVASTIPQYCRFRHLRQGKIVTKKPAAKRFGISELSARSGRTDGAKNSLNRSDRLSAVNFCWAGRMPAQGWGSPGEKGARPLTRWGFLKNSERLCTLLIWLQQSLIGLSYAQAVTALCGSRTPCRVGRICPTCRHLSAVGAACQ